MPWQLILMWGFLVGAGTGFLATVLSATIAARWFTARRGLVIGILSGGASTGQLLFLPVMANITAAYGWRTTVLSIAGVVCVVVPLVALFMRDRPQDVGLLPYGETGEVEARGARRRAIRSRSPSAAARRRARNATSGCWPGPISSAAPRPTA